MEFLNQTDMPALTIFKKGHMVFQEENPCHGFFYISAGIVKIYSNSLDGKETIHYFATEGDFIGLECFFGQGNHLYNAQVMEELKCSFFSRQTLKESFLHSPEIIETIFQKIGKVMDETHHRNAHFIRSGVRERMARCLCELAKSFGTEETEGIKIRLQLSREELASFLGVANETAIRFISEFKKLGILEEKDHFLIVKQKSKLEAICQRSVL